MGAEGETVRLLAALGALMSFTEAQVQALVAVFARVGAVAAMLPGFGERATPARVRLFGALAFTAIVWPAVAPQIAEAARPLPLGALIAAEAVAGLMLGLAVRMLVMALQFAGAIASQATSVLQIFGAGVTPDPMPAIGNMLTIAGVALALALDLHVKAAIAMIASYEVLPFGVFPVAGDLAAWGVARAAAAFSLAFALAAPFLAAGLAYNLALGAINRAMPQLMVALVGAPAITGGALLILVFAAPVMLARWARELERVLAAPFGGF